MMGKVESNEGTADAKSDSLVEGGPQEALIRCPYCVMSVSTTRYFSMDAWRNQIL